MKLPFRVAIVLGAHTDDEFLRGLTRVRGVQSNTTYAEAFEVPRWILR